MLLSRVVMWRFYAYYTLPFLRYIWRSITCKTLARTQTP